ncbi:hypothetical protein GC173_07670 [bacterium]|nr:hypothetical protein [bacterium]
MRRQLQLAFLAMIAAASAEVSAATINVSPGAGTIAAALSTAAAGDTLVLAAGNYTGSTVTINKSITILGPMDNVDPNGDLQADGSRPQTAGRGTGEAVLSHGFTLNNTTSGAKITDVTIAGLTLSGISGNALDMADPQGSERITFRYNIIQNFANQGYNRSQTTAPITDTVISYNRFFNYTGTDKTAIWMSGKGVNGGTVISHNYFADEDRNAGSRGIIVGGAYNATVDYNTFFRLGRYACQFADGANLGPGGELPVSIFRYNRATECNVGVQVLSTDATSGSPEGADISNNVFVNMLPAPIPASGAAQAGNNSRAILFARQSTGSTGPGVFADVSIFNNTVLQDVGLMTNTNALIDIQLDDRPTAAHGNIAVYRNEIILTGTYPNTNLDPNGSCVASYCVVSAIKTTAAGSGAVVVTHAGHPFVTGNVVNLTSDTGTFNAPVNGPFTITVIDADSYSLDNSAFLNTFVATSRGVQAVAPAVHGIRIRGEITDADIVNNSVSFSTTNEPTNPVPSSGIYVDNNDPALGAIPGGATINIQDNSVSGAETGIRLEAAPNTTVQGNTLNDNGTGILLTNEVTTPPALTGNNLVGNDVAIENASGSGVTGTNNFLGTNDGSTPPGSTVGDVTLNDNSTFPVVPADDDADGLSNDEEIGIYFTNPNNSDTDNDGIGDGIEVSSGTDPNDVADPGYALVDTDGDGIVDGLEIALGLDPNNRDENGDRILDGYALSRTGSITGAVTLGDADSNGMVNTTDATAILESFLGIQDLSVASNRDINLDGKIDNVDAVILYQWALNNIPYIPFP